jgi:beta-mannanase
LLELLEESLNQIYISSLECNGIHGVDFIRNKKKGNVIKIADYLKLDNAAKKEYKRIKHLGIKQEIKEIYE